MSLEVFFGSKNLGALHDQISAYGWQISHLDPLEPINPELYALLATMPGQFFSAPDVFLPSAEITPLADLRKPFGLAQTAVRTAAEKNLRCLAQLTSASDGQNLKIITRDTVQATINQNQVNIQHRTSEGGNSPLDQAVELSQADYSILTTAVIINGIKGFDSNNAAKYLIDLYDVFVFPSLNWLKLDRSPILICPLSLFSVRHQIAIFKLMEIPCDPLAYTNIPGGLDFDHPAVHEQLLVFVKNGEIGFSFGSQIKPETRYRQLTRGGRFVPYHNLSDDQRTAFQNLRRGSISPAMINYVIETQAQWLD